MFFQSGPYNNTCFFPKSHQADAADSYRWYQGIYYYLHKYDRH